MPWTSGCRSCGLQGQRSFLESLKNKKSSAGTTEAWTSITLWGRQKLIFLSSQGGTIWRAGTTPIKKRTLRGQMKSFMWVPINSGNRSGSCSERCGFRIAQVVGCHSENGISSSENGILNSESCSENTLELSESSENGLFTPRAFFLKLGWSSGF